MNHLIYNEVMKNVYDLINIIKGDITKATSDVIVNAANTSLLGGGGVDGAIHRAAGKELLEECKSFNGCLTGEAVITKGYNLKAKYVVHTPGPVYQNGSRDESKLLEKCYYNSMKLALQYEVLSISFPAISTGVYSYPKKDAVKIGINTVIAFMNKNKYYPEIFFYLFDNENYQIYLNYLSIKRGMK